MGPVEWQCEVSPFCQGVLRARWPNVLRFGDAATVDWAKAPEVDVVCAGFPCQPVSYPGSQGAERDRRWLWPEVERCIRVVRPRILLLENVPGILPRALGLVLGGLASCGYDAEWGVLPASAVGATQPRRRVFVLANRLRVGREECSSPHDEDRPYEARNEFDRRDPFPPGRGDLHAWARFLAAHPGAQPGVCRDAHGIPARVDRIRALGNAVVPAVAEAIGRRALLIDEATWGPSTPTHV